MMIGSSYNFWLVGLPFFQGYYTIHDMEAPSIGYIPHDNSRKGYLEEGEVPTQILEPIVHNFWLENGGYLFILGMAALGYFVIEPMVTDKYERGSVEYYAILSTYGIFVLLCYWFVIKPLLWKFFATEADKEAQSVEEVEELGTRFVFQAGCLIAAAYGLRYMLVRRTAAAAKKTESAGDIMLQPSESVSTVNLMA